MINYVRVAVIPNAWVYRMCVCVCLVEEDKEENGVGSIERSLSRLYSDKSKNGDENHAHG